MDAHHRDDAGGAHAHEEHEGPPSHGGHVGGARGEFTPREKKQARRLFIVLILIATFFAFELAGALAARSVVLQADAVHLLMDVLALAMSLLAMRVAVRKPTPRFTFGMRRAEPVAAIFNAMMVLAATAQIIREAVTELHGSGAPEAGLMMIVAVAALVVNGVSAWLLHGAMHHHAADEGAFHDHTEAHGADHPHDHTPRHAHGAHAHGHDHHGHGAPGPAAAAKAHGHALNLRGVWLHLIGDVLGSVAALVAAIVIRFGGPSAVDPIASFLVAAILIAGAFRLIRDATLVLLEAAPVHLPVGAVREVILAFPQVLEVHDLHVWTLGAGHDAITAHVRARDAAIARDLSRRLREAFETEYVTVQVEVTDEACGAPAKEP
jgi:cobalt-zinc-cadmium efflux system protein